MKFSRYLLRAAILAFAVVPATSPKPAHTDIYQIFDLGSGTRQPHAVRNRYLRHRGLSATTPATEIISIP